MYGKPLVGKQLEYLEILNDTVLYSSINLYTDTARFLIVGDTLYIKQRYRQTDRTGTKWVDDMYGYKILKLTADTLQLKNSNKAYNPQDTLVFISIDRIKEPTADFKFLRLECASPWNGTRQITIDSLGRVTFIDNPIMYSIDNPGADRNAKPANINGKLTKNEFEHFKSLLSKSLPSRLPSRRDCFMDGALSNFEITIGTKKITSSGCNLSVTHAVLLNYLYDIHRNEGLL